MRLVCPNCDAEYEVADDLIPAKGRDVQCSNCSVTWFQTPEGFDADEDAAPASGPVGLTPQRPQTDPEALDIIHEEVERERRARASEAGAVETQPDLGLSETDASSRDASVPEPATAELAPDSVAPAPQRPEPTKRELFPDIEEINSTLADAPDPVHEGDEGQVTPAVAKQKSGFRIGFGMMLMLTAALIALYVYAPSLIERFPAMGSALTTYVSIIDTLRMAIESGAQSLLAIVTDLTEQVGSSK